MPLFSKAARGALLLGLLSFSGCLFVLSGCGRAEKDVAASDEPPRLLSAYQLFQGEPRKQQPAEGVIPYDLNSALFSDYTSKYRFVKLPKGQAAKYDANSIFEFPVGTIIAKTFAYPHDMRDPSQGERVLETRILMRKPEGWVGLPYIWNAEATDAELALAGSVIQTNWIHTDGSERKNGYLVPNANQCKGCHKAESEKLTPIGPKARHLNRDYIYHDAGGDQAENQLSRWTRLGALEGAPSDPNQAPRLAVWNDPESGTLDQRARAWLEINCAHCHNPGGHARNAGLDLLASQTNPFQYGVFKPPVAAGRGSGGLRYDIVPGEPDESVLAFRIASDHPEIMMPELGKRLVHVEAVELIRQWIKAMPKPEQSATRPAAGQLRSG